MTKTCLTCSLWVGCKDKRKGYRYYCNKWEKLSIKHATFVAAEIEDDDEIKAPTINFAKASEKSLRSFVDNMLEQGNPLPPDLKVDDSDIRMAPNFFEWCMNKEFDFSGTTPFARQMNLGIRLMSEFCPHCSDMEWFDKTPHKASLGRFQEKVQLLQYGKCPKCKRKQPEMILEGDLPNPYKLVAILGQRSGKTALGTFIERYRTAHFLKLPNPPTAFGVMAGQMFTFTYAALSFGQAVNNFWIPFVSGVQLSSWYTNYHAFLKQIGERLGDELFHLKAESIFYRHRHLMLMPSGPNQRTMRGATRAGAMIDELGWFSSDNSKIKISGLEIHNALQRSMTTLQNAHEQKLKRGIMLPKPTSIYISSPSQSNDPIMTIYRDARHDKSVVRAKYATWKFNPTIARDSSIIVSAYLQDAVAAERDYGANPPMSASAWISRAENIAPAFSGSANGIYLRQQIFRNKSNKQQLTGKLTVNLVPKEPSRILCIDAGESSNSFAFAVGRPVDDRVIVEGLGELIPNIQTPISFTRVYSDVIEPLINEGNVKVVVSDRWQHIMLANKIEEETDAMYTPLRMNYGSMLDFREAILHRKVIFPKLDMTSKKAAESVPDYRSAFLSYPVAHVFNQCLTVQDRVGESVVKGNGMTDDLLRAVASLYVSCNDREIVGQLISTTQSVGAVVVFGAGGGGGGRSVSANGKGIVVR